MKTLIIFAHPDVENGSVANKVIINAVKDLENTEIRNLYQMYPDFIIDVEAEQKALMEADVIIFQFPFYWYSVPGMLKEWLDKVFLYGFAYGSTGDKLHGKEFLISATIGGPTESYHETGFNHFTIQQLLRPLQQTANLSGLKYNDPLVTHNMVYIPGVYNVKSEIEQRASEHANKLREFIEK